MSIVQSIIKKWNLKNQRVLLRADLSVPLEKGCILNDFRLQEIQPTLDYLLQNEATVVLITHIGRPQSYNENLSTKNLIPWFEKNGYKVFFAPTIEIAKQKSISKSASIILLENLRFFPGETTNDKNFATELTQLGDYYVNDAFGMLHRNHASITLVPELYLSEKKSIGFLIEKTIQILQKIKTNPDSPFLLIIGGAKVKDKIPLLKSLIKIVDSIMLCPAIVFSFLKAQSKPVGKSLVEKNTHEMCNKILRSAEQHNIPILFPHDYQVAQESREGQLQNTVNETISQNEFGISIGPKTTIIWRENILNARTIFFNGAVGFIDRQETLNGQKALFQAMADSNGTTIIAGGDSIAAVYHLGYEHKFDYLITGGGAALAYLGNEPLPGLEILNQ